ncbi:MAG: class I SAM-dependent methyltransferase [Saprospiraceae bacterium]|nr:class I SAM-dependent methyltransferase [Saprospiraceae bacterium]
MTVDEAVALIQPAVSPRTAVWADLGAGAGTFTLALSEILGFGSSIFAVDQKLSALKKRLDTTYVRSKILLHEKDFRELLEFPKLDGIIMANSLHYVRDQDVFLQQVMSYLHDDGIFILVEYDRETSNHWVPFPVTFVDFQRLALRTGLMLPEEVGRMPSQFGKQDIYAASTRKVRTDL